MALDYQQALDDIVAKAQQHTQFGQVANYIPALSKANPSDLAIAIYDRNNICVSSGNVSTHFTLQSISKIIALALALMDRGEDYVFQRVGMEPTGDPFNSIAKLETIKPSKPLNPMINAGALAVTNMIAGDSIEQKLGRILEFIHDMTDNASITYSEEVANSEFETAFLNRSLCYFLKQHNIITGDVEELMSLYTKQCAIRVTCTDLARIGAVLAFDGVDPSNGRRIIPHNIAKICKTFMVTCGMYNASGEFAIKVGIPAKSGVSGAILGAVQHKIGIGVYGPALDEKGNSIAGVELLRLLSNRYQLHIF